MERYSDNSINRNSARISVSKDKAVEESDERTSFTVLALISMFCSVGSAIVLFEAHSVKKDSFYPFAVYVLHVMNQGPYIQNLVNGAYFVSLALFLSSFLTSTGSVLNKRPLAKLGLFLSFISSGFIIAGGIIAKNYVGDLDTSVNSGAPSLSGPSREIQDFSLAMYERCCLLEHYVDADTAAFTAYIDAKYIDIGLSSLDLCSKLYTDSSKDLTSSTGKLEACIGSQTNLHWFRLATNDWMCGILKSTAVDTSTASFSGFDLSQLIDKDEVLIASEADKSSYGCGGGKIKAFQFTCYVWFKNITGPVSTTLIVVGTVTCLACFFGTASLCLSSNSSEVDLDMSVVEAYLNRQSARLDAQQQNFDQFNSNRASARISQRGMIPVAIPTNVDDKI